MISIIIPTLNEENNISLLVNRLNSALSKKSIKYELIFIDDHSTDKTVEIINKLSKKYPIKIFEKKGQKGKAQSIIEGFTYSKYKIISMIDADLQYPPEAIPLMIDELNNGLDIVVGNRIEQNINLKRKAASIIFRNIFGRLLHGFDCDVQSGLKVFRKEVIEKIKLNPSQWTFDLEFLVKARKLGYKIGSVDIEFAKRHSGKAKINILKASWEIGWSAIKLKFKK